MTGHIPLSVQTTYRDLLKRQVRRPTPEVEGSIVLVENKGALLGCAQKNRRARRRNAHRAGQRSEQA